MNILVLILIAALIGAFVVYMSGSSKSKSSGGGSKSEGGVPSNAGGQKLSPDAARDWLNDFLSRQQK